MAEKPCILIVDDERFNINVLVDLLKDQYRTLIAKDGKQALKYAKREPVPDLILLDIMMPVMDGYEVCQQLSVNDLTKNIPVIFISAMTQEEDEKKGLDLGAVDYISKPISPSIVKARVKTHLALKKAREYLEDQNKVLEEMVVERTRELALTQDVTILCMAYLAEARDNETGNHIRRTQHYIKLLALHLKDFPRFKDFLVDRTIELLFKSAPLHDIGKVGIPDSILLKPGKLTSEEFQIMTKHSQIGYDAILAAERTMRDSQAFDIDNSFLHIAREITYCHHEKWDGSGYPEKLKGDVIPISARLMALADVYDALTSKRVYKPAFSHEKAVEIIIEGRGSHFDPDVVDAFLALGNDFKEIAARYSDDGIPAMDNIINQ